MGKGARLSAAEYLDRFFEEIRAEARDNPAFAARLVRALGAQVVFSQSDIGAIANPIEIAGAQGEAGLRDTFGTLPATELRKLMRTANLATSVDMRGRDQADLVDLLVARACAKLSERRRS